MQLFVRDLAGTTQLIEVNETDSVETILESFGVESFVATETTLGLFEADEGAKKKKRKKKNFVSKKRVPHQRKKEKLKLLKLFKIGKDGSVEAARTECPHCKGSFMAKHKDGRLYCGSCHYTKTK